MSVVRKGEDAVHSLRHDSQLDTDDIILCAMFANALRHESDVIELGSRASLDRSPRKNWVEKTGRLPGYVREIARSIEKRGIPLSRAIPIAIGKIKDWARGGDNVNPDTVAKAQVALAQWTALKARNKARRRKRD